MILRRYGTSLQRVEPNFDSKALSEVGFRRDQAQSIPADQFSADYVREEVTDLGASAEGAVHDEVESAVLADLAAQLQALEERLQEGEVWVVENEQGVDYPKTHTDQRMIVVEGENRLHFTVRVGPPLRMGRYRKQVSG